MTVRATDAYVELMDLSERVLHSYVDDLSDADLKRIPIEGMNPIALQFGHLIQSERWFLESLAPGTAPALPEGFEQKHNLKEGNPADTSRYLPRDQYWALYEKQGKATKDYLAKLSEADLDKPSPETFRAFAPTVGSIMNMVGGHVMMHVGQFVVVRRQLGKPVVI
jgi:hypothetical protein